MTRGGATAPLAALLVALLGTVGTSSEAAPRLSAHVFERVCFGNIPVELCLYTTSEAEAETAAAAAFARIEALSAMMNDYAFEPASPLNRIAACAPEPVAVPPELFTILQHAIALHATTAGAFDITAKPYVQLWRTSWRLGELPPQSRLREARRYVDIGALILDEAAGTAALTREGMWLDLGGIAKGFVGDEVVRLLRERGVPICRYHAGGDMVFGDPPPGESGWPVTVPDFLVEGEDGGEVPLRLLVCNSAVSVSGDVFRHVDIDGKRYAHVIDPRTGLGVTERRITCVRGPRGVETDALATAGLILDADAFRAALARVPGCHGDVASSTVVLSAGRAPNGAGDCTLCTGQREVACVTCEGALELDQDCDACAASGKQDCPHCEKGRRPCPVFQCQDGWVQWSGGWGADPDAKKDRDPCRFCGKKGTLECKRCNRGQRTCVKCAGKRRYVGPCPDCTGTGKLPCALCRPPAEKAACLWCTGEGQRVCRYCEAVELDPRPCPDCLGAKKLICESCGGLGRTPCRRCAATGRMRVTSIGTGGATKGGVRGHEECDEKGIFRCKECKSGKVKCTRCVRGKVETCPLCDGERAAPCAGCHEVPYRSLELAGTMLQGHGAGEQAAACFEAARVRAEKHFEDLLVAMMAEQDKLKNLALTFSQLKQLFGDEAGEVAGAMGGMFQDQREGLKRQRDQELARLAKLRDEALTGTPDR